MTVDKLADVVDDDRQQHLLLLAARDMTPSCSRRMASAHRSTPRAIELNPPTIDASGLRRGASSGISIRGHASRMERASVARAVLRPLR